jgi:sterol desaturase/sphingolipid hydroxylase (fatty acid hydroxylase superfamily)
MMLVIRTAAVGALALLERVPRWRCRPQAFLRAHFGTDVVYLGTATLAGTSVALAYVGAASALVGAYTGLPRLSALQPPPWVMVPLAVLAIDAGNYATHWLMHRVEFLWELHKIHHSSRELDWLAATRFHILEQMLRRLLAPVLLIVAGFPLAAVAVAAGIFTAWAAFNHSNLRFGWPWLERVFVTPRLHRLHHDPATSERNLGTVLTLWDRLRGTLTLPAGTAPHQLGVPGEVETYPQGWNAQLIEPLRRWRNGASSEDRRHGRPIGVEI